MYFVVLAATCAGKAYLQSRLHLIILKIFVVSIVVNKIFIIKCGIYCEKVSN